MATLHKKHRKSDPLDALRPFAPGDAPGVLGRGRARRWLVKYPRAVPVGIFLAIIAITAFSVFAIESNARARERAQLSERAESIVSALERRASSYAAFLRAGAALFAGREAVTPREFQQFVSELRLDDQHRGVEGIGWINLVRGSELEGFIASQRELQPAFKSIRPIPDPAREAIGPVIYFAPETSPYHTIIGFDMASEPIRAAAMQKARDAMRPIASGRVVLMGEGIAGVPGFDIFMPVYRRMGEGPGARRELAGFIFSKFHGGRFLDAAIDNAPAPGLGVRLYDTREAGTDNLLAARPASGASGLRVEQAVSIADRELLLVVESPEASTLATLSMVTLLFGLALASLLMLLARLLTQQALEDQARLAFYEEQHSIRNSLTRELNHRVKNTLANVLSILSLTRRRTSNLNDFATSLEGRIRALSATHDLLTGSDWGTTALRAVIEAEMQHFRFANDEVIVFDGPEVELAPNDALSFGLAIHELATNAAKYGALSVPEGRVEVRWQLVEPHLAEITWVERGGPEVGEITTRGFGTELIQKVVAHELRQPVELAFEPSGVRCVMRVPVRRRGDFRMRADAAIVPTEP
ncbi:MAG: CHASE domain-containing protein [Erythrobacter sp.]|jgi:two-component sensor histidine kinase|nr:CHASE domain-containing protein [Erythrobacter sp.]